MRHASLTDYAILVLLGALWGSGFMFIKVGIETIPPATLTAGRLFLGALILAVAAAAAGQRLPRDRASWFALAMIGVFSYAAPFYLIGWGEQFIDSGLAALLMSASPFFAILLAHYYAQGDRFTWPKLAGALIGFLGIAVLIGFETVATAEAGLMGAVAVLLAGFCFSLGGVFVVRVGHLPATAASAAALALAGLATVPVSLAFERPWEIEASSLSLGALVYLAVVNTAFASLLRWRIILRVGVSFLALVAYLIPLFGLLFGVSILGEPLTVQAGFALAAVLLGIWVSRIGPTTRSIPPSVST